MIINIGRRGQDGRSAWELRYGRNCLEDRWHKGVYLAPCLRTSDSLVGTAEGTVVKARTLEGCQRARREQQKWSDSAEN
eukprot:117314-Amphidinium_carterae.1